jgi:hypothetical protein
MAAMQAVECADREHAAVRSQAWPRNVTVDLEHPESIFAIDPHFAEKLRHRSTRMHTDQKPLKSTPAMVARAAFIRVHPRKSASKSSLQ